MKYPLFRVLRNQICFCFHSNLLWIYQPNPHMRKYRFLMQYAFGLIPDNSYKNNFNRPVFLLN